MPLCLCGRGIQSTFKKVRVPMVRNLNCVRHTHTVSVCYLDRAHPFPFAIKNTLKRSMDCSRHQLLARKTEVHTGEATFTGSQHTLACAC